MSRATLEGYVQAFLQRYTDMKKLSLTVCLFYQNRSAGTDSFLYTQDHMTFFVFN